MTALSQWLQKAVIPLLGLMIAVDGALYLYVRTHTADDPDLFYRYGVPHELVPIPDGFTAEGVKVDVTHGPTSGWVVRFASKSCHFCQQDEPLWNPLSKELKEMGYRVIVVVPTAKDKYPSDSENLVGAQQETYVDIGWIRQFRLSMTPTLMIFNPQGDLLWSHQGVLGRDDPASALRSAKSRSS